MAFAARQFSSYPSGKTGLINWAWLEGVSHQENISPEKERIFMTLLSDEKSVPSSVSTAEYDVAVVGAGPYGLSAAAYLLQRKLHVAVFGKPMSFWQEHMPRGMYLRSYWEHTNLGDPQKRFGLDQFVEATATARQAPMPIQMFIDYGLWFQKQAVPHVDETYVASIEREDGRFLLTLVDGRRVSSRAVVMAVGVGYYAYSPAEYATLPADSISHTVEHQDLSRFAGKQVAVIGRGQSAVESAALLHEAGAASVHLLTRGPIYWLPSDGRKRSLREKLRWPGNGISPGWKNWALHHFPYFFHDLSQERRYAYVNKSLFRAASAWLQERVNGKVVVHEGDGVQKVEVIDGQVALQLASGEAVTVDHVLLATGYQVDIKRLPMLHPSLLAKVQVDERNTPVLSSWFESNVPGLYFVGLTSLWNFGPLYRFVCGAKAAAERVSSAVASHVARERRRERRLGK